MLTRLAYRLVHVVCPIQNIARVFLLPLFSPCYLVHAILIFLKFYMSRDMTKPTNWVCAQQRLRSASSSAQSDQSLDCPHEESYWAHSEDWSDTLILLVLSCRGSHDLNVQNLKLYWTVGYRATIKLSYNISVSMANVTFNNTFTVVSVHI